MPGTESHGARHWLKLAIFLLIVVGGGSLIGAQMSVGEWYDNLEKPFFNPPAWVFGPAWFILYVLIAIAGWRTWNRNPAGLEMQVWFAQLALNFFWTPVFFGMRLPGLALVVIAGMLALIVAFVVLDWKRDRVGALLFIPYLAWVSYAALLNLSIWWMN